jgi:beta-lactamase class A
VHRRWSRAFGVVLAAAVLGSLSSPGAAMASAPARCPPARPAPSPSPVVLLRSGTTAPPSPSASLAEAPVNDLALERLIEDALGDESDHYAVVVRDLRTGTGAAINDESVFYAASLFKLPIMVEAYRQRAEGLISFDDEIVTTWSDLEEDLGTFPGDVGDSYTIDDMLEMMITLSDNTSAIMLVRTLGPELIDESMQTLGLTETSVFTDDLPTTARDMARLVTLIALDDVVSRQDSIEMQARLLRQTWRHRIPSEMPDDVLIGNKTGDWLDAAHDVAIVYASSGTYVLAILSDGLGSDQVIADLALEIYDYYQSCARPALASR